MPSTSLDDLMLAFLAARGRSVAEIADLTGLTEAEVAERLGMPGVSAVSAADVATLPHPNPLPEGEGPAPHIDRAQPNRIVGRLALNDRRALPAGHPVPWRAITDGTVLHGAAFTPLFPPLGRVKPDGQAAA